MDAYRIGVTIAMAGNVSQFLASMSSALTGVHLKVKDLEGGLNRVKSAMMGAAGVAGGMALAKALGTAAEKGSELLDQQEKLRRSGISQNDVLRMTANYYDRIAKAIPTAKASEYLRTINELRTVVGSLKEAEEFAPEVLKMQALIGNATGRNADREGYNLLRALELKGVTASDPEQTKALFEAFGKAVAASGGKVSATDFYQLAKTGGVSYATALPEFLTGVMPTVIGDMGGFSAGTAMMTAWMKMHNIQQISKVQLAALRTAGLLDESKLQPMGNGHFALQPGGIKGSLESSDMYTWAKNFLTPALQGIKDQKGANVMWTTLGQMAGSRNAIKFFQMMADPNFQAQIEKDMALRNQAMGVNAGYAGYINNNPKGVEAAYESQKASMLQAMGAPLMQAAIPVMKELTSIFTRMGKLANDHPEAIKLVGEALVGLAGAMVIIGGAAVVAAMTMLLPAEALIAAAAVAIASIVAVIAAANWDKLKDLGATIGKVASEMGAAIMAIPGEVAGAISSAFSSIGSAISNAIKGLVGLGSSSTPGVGGKGHAIAPHWGKGGTVPAAPSTPHGIGHAWNAPQKGSPIVIHNTALLDGDVVHQSTTRRILQAANYPRQAPAHDGYASYVGPDAQAWMAT